MDFGAPTEVKNTEDESTVILLQSPSNTMKSKVTDQQKEAERERERIDFKDFVTKSMN